MLAGHLMDQIVVHLVANIIGGLYQQHIDFDEELLQ